MPPAAARPRPDRATRLLDSFRARFGAAHELFACHAAFPAALTPELAYQLWAAFRADAHGRPLGVPWIAVADLLLSPLCAEIGEELYEMAPDVRAVLRRRLLDDPRLGSRRVGELSELLFDVAVSGLHSEDAHERTLAQAQRLTALAHSAPERAAALLAGMLAEINADDHAAWMRMASLTAGLAEPLAAFPALAQVASAMAARGRGEPGPLAAFVREHGAAVEVGGVRLSVAEPAPVQPLEEPPRRLRVLVVGTALTPLDDMTTWAAGELGRALAEAGHSLLVGGWPGVDDTIAGAFVAQLEYQGEAVDERLTRIVYPGESPAFRTGRVVELERTTDAAWIREALQGCDAVVVIGGAGFVARFVRAADAQGKAVIPLPWTGETARHVTDTMMASPRRPDAPVMMQAHARRLLEGQPRFRSDARYLVDRVMAVLALHDPAAQRAYRAYSRGMAHLIGSVTRPDASGPSTLLEVTADLIAAADVDRIDASAGPDVAIQEIEATLPEMVHWLVADFIRLRAVHGGAADLVLPFLAPLLARHAQHLARPVIGRLFDDINADLDPWFLRWMHETRQLLRPDEYQRWVQEIACRWAGSYLTDASPEDGVRTADAILRALRAAELSPQAGLLLPLLTDPLPTARVAGYLVCRAFAVPASAETLDASLRLEQQAVEESGATGRLRQLLGCYEVVPGIDRGAAARLAAAGLERMLQVLEGMRSEWLSCRAMIGALLHSRFREARQVLRRLDAISRRYEPFQRVMYASSIGTARLDGLVQEIGELLKEVKLSPEELSMRFKAGGVGDRVIALVGVFVANDPASFTLVQQSIEQPRFALEQYLVLRAASRMLHLLDRASLEALRAALAHPWSDAQSSIFMKESRFSLRDMDREVRKGIAALLDQAQQHLLDMVPIPAGRFWMGSEEGEPMAFEDEHPFHEVELSAFEMARVPVTQRQYREVMGDNPSAKKEDEWPVLDVSWRDAIRFCNALSEREGLTPAYRIDGGDVAWDRAADGYRLPTEAEWEYAARGADGRIYPWGNEPPSNQLCWNGEGNDLGKLNRVEPSPVGRYPSGASPFGLLDMAGNVLEWCWDRYAPYRKRIEAQRNPWGSRAGSARVLRGGSWISYEPADVRAADRHGYDPSWSTSRVGFRCARGSAWRPG